MTAKELYSKIVSDLTSGDDPNYLPSHEYFIEGFGNGLAAWLNTGSGYCYIAEDDTTVEYINLGYRQMVVMQKDGQTIEKYVKDLYPVIELRQKWEDLAKATGIGYELIYYAFKTATDYYGDENKDEEYWCDVFYERCCEQKAKELIATNWDDYPALADGMKKAVVEDLNFADIEEEEVRERLKRIANGGAVKLVHLHAMSVVVATIMKFMQVHQKHPFNYALDMREDLEKFFKIEAAFRDHILN